MQLSTASASASPSSVRLPCCAFAAACCAIATPACWHHPAAAAVAADVLLQRRQPAAHPCQLPLRQATTCKLGRAWQLLVLSPLTFVHACALVAVSCAANNEELDRAQELLVYGGQCAQHNLVREAWS